MTTEQLVREALQAKAAQVRPEQVDMPFPVSARARRPVRAGLAMAVAATVAAVLTVTWAIAARPGDAGQRAAAAGPGTSAATTASGTIVSSPFDLPKGWTGMSVSVTDRYATWCVTNDVDPGSARCSGLMVYQAFSGRSVPVDDALVPACSATSTAQKQVTAVTIDGRAASLITDQCRPTDPAWLVWRTADGAFAMVAQRGSTAAGAAARILPGVHLPGGPVAASAMVSEPPVASTSTCPPVPRDRSGTLAASGAAGPTGATASTAGSVDPIASTAGSAAPVASTGPASTENGGCPTG